MYMTKEQFLELQLQQQTSGVSVKIFCQQQSISYSTFNYWRKKCQSSDLGGLVPLTDNIGDLVYLYESKKIKDQGFYSWSFS